MKELTVDYCRQRFLEANVAYVEAPTVSQAALDALRECYLWHERLEAAKAREIARNRSSRIDRDNTPDYWRAVARAITSD